MSMKTTHSRQGFTLIEVLIALVILAVGLLGMATLMMNSLQSSQSAYLRSQASLLTYDIIERLRTNRTQAITTDDYTLTDNASLVGNPGCGGDDRKCSPSQQAQLDLHQWQTALTDSIPDVSASISRDKNQYEISITWSEAGAALDGQPGTATSSFNVKVDI